MMWQVLLLTEKELLLDSLPFSQLFMGTKFFILSCEVEIIVYVKLFMASTFLQLMPILGFSNCNFFLPKYFLQGKVGI